MTGRVNPAHRGRVKSNPRWELASNFRGKLQHAGADNRRDGGPWRFVGPENLVRVVRRLTDRPTTIEVDTDDTLRGYLMRNITLASTGPSRAPANQFLGEDWVNERG
jgi:hypothetical protein